MKNYYVYIMASAPNGTLYTGVTADLIQRVWQHKNGVFEGFTKEYKISQLVYYEVFNDAYQAITREKNIKAWKRSWKIRLIQEVNPKWQDLYPQISGN